MFVFTRNVYLHIEPEANQLHTRRSKHERGALRTFHVSYAHRELINKPDVGQQAQGFH